MQNVRQDLLEKQGPCAIEAEYYCTAEWHFARMRSKYTALLHGFALRISVKSGRFYCSQIRLADYLGCSRRSVWTAIHELEKGGFLLRIESPCFWPNVYKVLDHSTWAQRNPGKCAVKIEMPWKTDGPELGRQLYAISGGRVKFRPEQIAHLQSRLTDEEIRSGFQRLMVEGIELDKYGFIRTRDLDWGALCQGT